MENEMSVLFTRPLGGDTRIAGITGAAVLAQSGEIANSNIGSKELNEFFELLVKVAYDGKSATALGEVRRMLVRTDKDEDLSLMLKDKQALAIVSERSRPHSAPSLS